MSQQHHCEAPGCTRPTNNTLCNPHHHELLQLAKDLPDWIIDLTITLTRQTRSTTTATRTTGDPPLPYNPRAGTILHTIATTLTDAHHTHRPTLLANLKAITRQATKTVIPPAPKWYAGKCNHLTAYTNPDGTTTIGHCPRELYANTETGTITCPLCTHTHDIAERRNDLLTQAEDVLATATEAARAIVVWSDYERGETRLVRRIGMWAARGRITQHGTGRPLYRIGDILDLLATDDTQPTKATA